MTVQTNRVVIMRNDCDEYEVPDTSGDVYFTTDRDDAAATARTMHGAAVRIVWRRGSYTIACDDDGNDMIVPA